jgi:hypothetical protein
MISLSDSELSQIMSAARPLQPQARSAFLVDVASELAKQRELGPGIVGRVVREVQRKHFDAPNLGSVSKYE